MADGWFAPEREVKRSGVFNGRKVYASKRVNERGHMGWEVTTWTDGEPQPENYLIAYGKIEEEREMDDTKKQILLNAIKQWQAEEIDRLCT